MSTGLLLATRNNKKKIELQEILADLNIRIFNLEDISAIPEVEEDGQTFEENAIKKAIVTAKLSGFITLADDSGLEVDALGGRPGVYSARFAGNKANDRENNDKLLNLLKQVELAARTARFTCVIAIATPQGSVQTVRASCEGIIGFELHGRGGFGYDPLFIPNGFNKTFAELSAQEKHTISHRGKALKESRPILEDLFK